MPPVAWVSWVAAKVNVPVIRAGTEIPSSVVTPEAFRSHVPTDVCELSEHSERVPRLTKCQCPPAAAASQRRPVW